MTAILDTPMLAPHRTRPLPTIEELMPQFDIAHVREQGQDIIIIQSERAFGSKSSQEQEAIIAELQACARAAGLAGTVVPVWDSGGGRMSFIAPRPWHPFFSGLSLGTVAQNLNKRLTCG